jgi:hypothetical protein
MSENKLNRLAMANINKKEQFDESEIITEFARNSLKMQLSEWSKYLNTENKIIIIIIIY